jgi:hypothetical protein
MSPEAQKLLIEGINVFLTFAGIALVACVFGKIF